MDDLHFGSSLEKAEEVLGAPSETESLEKEPDDETETLLYYYFELGVTLFFEGDDSMTLTCIETDNQTVTLFGKRIFEMDENQVIALLKENGYSELYMELEVWGEKRVSFDDALIDFYFENGKMVTVNWGIMINGDEEEDF